jgi:FMN phosphatase YigB (HAD superfamily)
MAHDTGVSSDIIESAFWHFNDAICRGDMSLSEGNRAIARRMGVESVDWLSYYLKAVEPVKEAQEAMAWAAEHYKVGIISNTFPGFIDALQQHKILPEIPYTTIIDSSAVKAIKPEAKIYKIATERAEVPAEEILFIDDARGNLMAAEKQGWRVMWFDDFQPKECAARIKKILEF